MLDVTVSRSSFVSVNWQIFTDGEPRTRKKRNNTRISLVAIGFSFKKSTIEPFLLLQKRPHVEFENGFLTVTSLNWKLLLTLFSTIYFTFFATFIE